MSDHTNPETVPLPCSCKYGCETCTVLQMPEDGTSPQPDTHQTDEQEALTELMGQMRTYGTPQRGGLAMFALAGPAVSTFGFSSTMLGVLLCAILTLFRGYIFQSPVANGGIWMMLLHHTTALAALAALFPALLTDPLKTKLDSWLTTHDIIYTPYLLPPVVILVLSALFVLGLEKSRLLRKILLILLGVTTWTMLIVGSVYFCHRQIFLPDEPFDFGPPMSLYSVLGATTFVITVFSGTTGGMVWRQETQLAQLMPAYLGPHEPTGPPSPAALHANFLKIGFAPLMVVHEMFSATLFFVIGAVKMDWVQDGTVYVFSVFQNDEITLNWSGFPELMHFVMRDVFRIVVLVAICISLVETMHVCVRYLELATSFFPLSILWTNDCTGTRIKSICIIGAISSILAGVHCVKDLIILSGMSYFISYTYELVLGFIPRYKLCSSSSTQGLNQDEDGEIQYQPVDPEGNPVDNEDIDMLSNDSGHSTDTDIDGIVNEYRLAELLYEIKIDEMEMTRYKHNIEVFHITFMTQCKAQIGIFLTVVDAIAFSYSSQLSYSYISGPVFAFAMVIIMLWTSLQPQQFWINNRTCFLRPPQLLYSWPALHICVFLAMKTLVVLPLPDLTSATFWTLLGLFQLRTLWHYLKESKDESPPVGCQKNQLNSPAWLHLLLIYISVATFTTVVSLQNTVCLIVWILAGTLLRMRGKKWKSAVDPQGSCPSPPNPNPF